MKKGWKINPEWKNADFEFDPKLGYWVPTKAYLKKNSLPLKPPQSPSK